MIFSLVLVGALVTGSGPPGPLRPAHPELVDGGRVTAPAEFAAFVARRRVPSFARQLRLSCGVCHVGFPELTWFGRMFKLNGYTLTGLSQIVDQGDSASNRTLSLTPIPAMSVSALISSTSVAKGLPGTPVTRAEYPQQLSILWGGQVSEHVGALLQLTYSDVPGAMSIDVSDIRYARHLRVRDRDLLVGASLHNTPTAQDPWNTLPAWSFPFVSSALAPQPAAGTLLDGALAQQVLGVGAYGLYNQLVYAEVSTYNSAPQGPRALVDSMVPNTLADPAVYWRLAVQHNVRGTQMMIGTFGLSADLFAIGTTGQPSRYSDIGVDAQVERPVGRAQLIGRATWTHEDRSSVPGLGVPPGFTGRVKHSLSTVRANGTIALPSAAFTLGAFSTTGTSDPERYPELAITGSATNRPDTRGQVAELVFNRWINSRVGMQYVRYDTFNGRASSYDVGSGGRSAADNNTFYLYLWLAF